MVPRLLIVAVMQLTAACSEHVEETGNHVWKTQTDMIDKAHEVEDMLMDSSARQRRLIDEQAR